MSENISLPAARVPLVDERGLITKEWMTWFIGMFRRAGGAQGFSNAELYGDAATQQSYDELLERISALEAQNRELQRGIQMLALGQIDTWAATPPMAISPETFSRIKVLGETDLATERGAVRVAGGVNGSNAKLQVGGDWETSGGGRVRGALQVDGEAGVAALHVAERQVVGGRVTGIPAYGGYSGQESPTASDVDSALVGVAQKLAIIITALRQHGLIGD